MSKYTIKAVCRGEARKDGSKAVSIRLTIERQPQYFNVSEYSRVSVLPQYWNEVDEVIKKGDPEHKEKNAAIASRKEEIEKTISRLMLDETELTWDSFFKRFSQGGGKIRKHLLADFIETELSVQKNAENLNEGTINNYRKLLNKINEYSPEIKIEDIDEEYVKDFKNYIRNLPTIHSKNTFSKYLKWLTMYLDRAIDKKIITENPCKKIKKLIESQPADKKPLFENEIKSIIKLNIPAPGENAARLRFLFSCCTGMAHEDVNELLWSDIQIGGDILVYVRKKMKSGLNQDKEKLGRTVIVPLLPLAQEVLAELPKEGKFVFKRISNQTFNAHLKNIREKAGISKKVTSHIARHSCGTMLLNAGIKEELVRDILGHTHVRQTRDYARYTNKSLFDAVQEVSKQIKLTLKDAVPVPVRKLNEMLKNLEDQQAAIADQMKEIKATIQVQETKLKVV